MTASSCFARYRSSHMYVVYNLQYLAYYKSALTVTLNFNILLGKILSFRGSRPQIPFSVALPTYTQRRLCLGLRSGYLFSLSLQSSGSCSKLLAAAKYVLMQGQSSNPVAINW